MKQSPTEITKEQICSCFHLPISLACLNLKTDITTLTNKCREYGIKRWQYNAHRELKIGKKTIIEKKEVGCFIEFKNEKKKNLILVNYSKVGLKNNLDVVQLPSFSEFLKISLDSNHQKNEK